MLPLLLNQKTNSGLQIFETIQGEGVFLGLASFFIRLQGCSVKCFFCDEKSTWDHHPADNASQPIDGILDRLEIINPKLKRVVITGGEPSEQDIVPLIRALAQNGFKVALETAATGAYMTEILNLQQELNQEFENDKFWITFSPKEPYSDNAKVYDQRIWAQANELKFVYSAKVDPLKIDEYIVEKIIKSLGNEQNFCPIFLSPDYFDFEQSKARILALIRVYPRILRLTIQAHKYWGIA